ncbi:hypothetical protein ACTXGQ_30975 [Marinobacter sp. 1Y8]
MVDTSKLTSVAKDVLLAPVYLYQGRKIKRGTVRLPEPHGERHGMIELPQADNKVSTQDAKTFNLMVVGDSAAAGVGSQTQQEALVGKLIPILEQNKAIQSNFARLN